MSDLAPEARFRRAVTAYDDDPRVEVGTGFGGSPGRRVEGRIFAMLANGELVVKLPAGRVSDLTSSGVGRPFDAGKGRPMREWISVPPVDPDPWPGLVAEAYAFVGGGTSQDSGRTGSIGETARRSPAGELLDD